MKKYYLGIAYFSTIILGITIAYKLESTLGSFITIFAIFFTTGIILPKIKSK